MSSTAMTELDVFDNEAADRFCIGTHDPGLALEAFRRADRDRPEWSWTIRDDDVDAFEYGWYARVEPAHPDYAVDYLDVDPQHPEVVPGICLPA